MKLPTGRSANGCSRSIYQEIHSQEQATRHLHLILTHHQCLLYISARKYAGNEENMKEWYVKQQQYPSIWPVVQRLGKANTLVR